MQEVANFDARVCKILQTFALITLIGSTECSGSKDSRGKWTARRITLRPLAALPDARPLLTGLQELWIREADD